MRDADAPIRVFLSATSYPAAKDDWKGRFILDLSAALARRPDVRLHIWAPDGPRPDACHEATSSEDRRWLQTLMAAGGIAAILRRNPLRALPWILGLLLRLARAYRRHPDTDIYHVNWLQCALPLPRTRQPAVLAALGSDYALIQRPMVAAALRWAIGRRPAVVTPNAQWMAPVLQQKLGSRASVSPVAFGVDDRWFGLQREPQAPGSRRWLAVIRVTRAKLGPLFQWWQQAAGSDDELHLLGPQQEPVEIPDWVHYHGATHPDELYARWFPGAAGLITLSAHDEGRPQVMLEAMAASLPVIASDLPAHRDLLSNGETGCLVADAAALKTALTALGDAEHNVRTGAQARAWIRSEIGTWDDCAARYVAHYRQLLTTANGACARR